MSSMEEYTVEEIRDRLYPIYECNICQHFDLDDEKCLKNRKPRKYLLLDGPNEFCHAHFSCFLWEVCEMDSSECIKNGLGRFFAV